MIKDKDRFQSIRKGLVTVALLILIHANQLKGQIVNEVASVTITVSSLEHSISFFTNVLDFTKISEVK